MSNNNLVNQTTNRSSPSELTKLYVAVHSQHHYPFSLKSHSHHVSERKKKFTKKELKWNNKAYLSDCWKVTQSYNLSTHIEKLLFWLIHTIDILVDISSLILFQLLLSANILLHFSARIYLPRFYKYSYSCQPYQNLFQPSKQSIYQSQPHNENKRNT